MANDAIPFGLPDIPVRRMRLRPLAILLPIYALIDPLLPLAIMYVTQSRSPGSSIFLQQVVISASFAAILGQWSLLAIWGALSPGRWPLRVGTALTAGAALTTIFCATFRIGDVPSDLSFICTAPLGILVLQLPLWGLRFVRGWHLSLASNTDGEKRRTFTLGQLFWTTSVAASAIALARWTTPAAEMAAEVVALAIAAVIVMVPALWAAMGSRSLIMAHGMLLAYFATLVAAAVVAAQSTGAIPDATEDLLPFLAAMLTGFTLMLQGSLLVIRLTGYRLSRNLHSWRHCV